jgi:hypothetical protein
MMANCEDGLLASNRIGADDRVLGGELAADVQLGAAGFFVEAEFVALGCLGEEWLGVCCG